MNANDPANVELNADPIAEEQGNIDEIPLADAPIPMREEQERLEMDVPNMQPHLEENLDEMPANDNRLLQAVVVLHDVLSMQPHLDENLGVIPIDRNEAPDTREAAAPMGQFQTDADFQLAVDLQLAYDIADAPATPEKREESKRDRRAISKLNYEVFTCCVCTKHFQTNDFPSLEDGEHVCSPECYRKKLNDL